MKTALLAFDEADDDSQIAESFASKVRGFSLQQSRTLVRETGGRRWHERLRLQWGYTNKDIQYSEEIGSPDIVAGNRAFLSVALIGDERDSLTDPRKGVFWTATTEWSRRFLGSDVDYVRLYGQVFTYLPVARGVVWAQGLRPASCPGTTPSTCSRTASRPAGRRRSAASARTASVPSSPRTRASAARASSS